MKQSEPEDGKPDFAVCDFCFAVMDLTYDDDGPTEWIATEYAQLYCKRCAAIWKTVNIANMGT